jgi:hypothetical protein
MTKLCKDCVFFRSVGGSLGILGSSLRMTCMHREAGSDTVDLVTGREIHTRTTCEVMRNDPDGLCGVEARLFEQMQPT